MMVVKENKNEIIMMTTFPYIIYTIDYYVDKLISVCKN